MSAVNGVLGALCERVKVIHVVGQTSRPLQQGKMMIHHSVGNHDNEWEVDHQKYNKMSKGARIAEAELWEAESAPAEIDVSYCISEVELTKLLLD
jgi:pyruvate decarboxylase